MRPAILVCTVCTLLIGCQAADRRDLEFELAQSKAERDKLRTSLDNAEARVAALSHEMTGRTREWEAAKAEVNALRAQLARLTEANQQLVSLIESQTAQAVEPPSLPAALPDEIDRKLRSYAARHTNRVVYDPQRGALRFANDLLFPSGSDEIMTDAHAAIGELAAIAARTGADEWEIIVIGHTDDQPITRAETLARHPSNSHLSVHRAIAFRNLLVSAGLPEKRIGVMGFGANRPISSDLAQNRRVEVYFVRKGDMKSLGPVQNRPATPVR